MFFIFFIKIRVEVHRMGRLAEPQQGKRERVVFQDPRLGKENRVVERLLFSTRLERVPVDLLTPDVESHPPHKPRPL